MKLLKLKNWILVVSILTLIFSCTKDEETIDEAIVVNAKRLELVTLDLSNSGDLNEEYNGTLGSENVKLYKTDTGKLSFIIPDNQNLGSNELKIENFSRQITINVSEIILTDTPENIIQPLLNNFETFSQTLTDISVENTNIHNSINAANTIFQNSSTVEKEKAAKFYLINKSLIDEIILDDYSNISGKTNSIIYYDKKFYKAVLVMGVSSAICVLSVQAFQTSPNVLGAVAVISGITALVSAKKAKQLGIQTMEDNLMIYDHPEIDGTDGVNYRNTNLVVTLTNDTDNTVPFSFKTRKITSNDSNSTKERTKNFFLSYNKFNVLINKLNQPIIYINTNYPSLSIPQFPLLAIATSSPVISVGVTASTFSKVSFSISNPNIQLVSSTFLQDGEMKIKAKIINSNLTSINGSLIYNYEDEFRKFSGTIPITVTGQNSIVGTWKQTGHIICGVDIFTFPPSQVVQTSCGFGYSGLEYCLRDDLSIFNSNMTCEFNEGATSCSPPQGTITGNYSLSSNNTLLTTFSGSNSLTREILQLDSNLLKLKTNQGNYDEIEIFQRQ